MSLAKLIKADVLPTLHPNSNPSPLYIKKNKNTSQNE